MKRILNVRVPIVAGRSNYFLEISKTLINVLKNKLSDDYHIIISPEDVDFQIEGMTILQISHDTDLEKLIEKLKKYQEDNEIPVQFIAEFPLNVPTRNGNIYTTECMEKAINDERIRELCKARMLTGRLTLPLSQSLSSHQKTSIDPILDDVFRIDQLEIISKENSDILIGKLTTLNTPDGKELANAIMNHHKFQFAPRGIGRTNDEGIIQDDFRIITFDLVPEKEDNNVTSE